MRFWWRELSGWLLIGLAVLGFVLVYEFCMGHYLMEAWVIAVIALVVFWGGVQLLKVAIAARICQQAQDQLYPQEIRRANHRVTESTEKRQRSKTNN